METEDIGFLVAHKLKEENDRLRAVLLKAYQFISPLSDPMPVTAGEMAREIMSSLSSDERSRD
jgi:hypothetical protein